MGKFLLASLLLVVLNSGALLPSLACPYCPYPTPPTKPPKAKPPPLVKPPYAKPPPHMKPPPHVKPPPYVPKPPPTPPKVSPPYVPKPPPTPPKVSPPYSPKPPPTPCPPPPPKVVPKPPPAPVVPTPPYVPEPPPAQETCPIDTLKLGACVDLLGGLINIGIGSGAKDTCCPVLQGLVDLDAAICLCTTIKAKLLNINLILPIALEVLIDCGKTPPNGFKCPA